MALVFVATITVRWFVATAVSVRGVHHRGPARPAN